MTDSIDNFLACISWDVRTPSNNIYVYTNNSLILHNNNDNKNTSTNGSIYTASEIVRLDSEKAPANLQQMLKAKFSIIPKRIRIPILPYRDTYTIHCNFTEPITIETFLSSVYHVYQKEMCDEDVANLLASCEADTNGYQYLRDHIAELRYKEKKIKLLDFLITNSGKSYT